MGKMILFKNGVYTLIEHSLTDKEIEELSKPKIRNYHPIHD